MSILDNDRGDVSALTHRAFESNRNANQSWLISGIAGTALLAWGIGSNHPAIMVAVVLTAAVGFMTTSRWREQERLLTGYLEARHENGGPAASYFTQLGRARGAAGVPAGREWHPTLFFNLLGVSAAVLAWTMASHGERGELWAGIVTGAALVLASYSVSETSRIEHIDAAAWRRSEPGLREVRKAASY